MALTASALAELMKSEGTFYIAVGTAADLLAETITEITDPTYARKAHSAWITDTSSGSVWRRNNGAIVFNALTDGATDVAWWAIFTASVGGTMLAVGPLLNLDGKPQPVTLEAGDQLRFNDGELRLVSTPEVL